MTTLDTIDAPTASAVLDRPVPPVPESIVAARAAIAATAADFLAMPDSVLERPWTWREVENEVARMAVTMVTEANSARAAAEA
jgi:hypothetical protein